MNFSFKQRNKTFHSLDINQNVLDEMRRQRKITMVLGDLLLVEQYINADITEINLNNKELYEDKSLDIKLIIQDKLDFRYEFA
jgi:hypothetical protein